MAKERLDVLLVNQGLAETREKAKAAIMARLVQVNGQPADKPGTQYDENATITVQGKACPYVSRGGLKLEKALREMDISITGSVCADIGASTGGFTDCMLQNGAIRVYAIDVGYGQLDWKLRNRPDVINMERTNIRSVAPESFPEPLDFASVDVSFISLKLVLPVAMALLRESGRMVCLIKPQFEAGREHVGKNGVVRNPDIHNQVLETTVSLVQGLGGRIDYLTFSPIKGPKGNIEFLIGFQKMPENLRESLPLDTRAVVAEAHRSLAAAAEPPE